MERERGRGSVVGFIGERGHGRRGNRRGKAAGSPGFLKLAPAGLVARWEAMDGKCHHRAVKKEREGGD